MVKVLVGVKIQVGARRAVRIHLVRGLQSSELNLSSKKIFQDCCQRRFAIEIVRLQDWFSFGKTSSFNTWVHRRNLVLCETKKTN